MSLQQLLLPERLAAIGALERLLVRVHQDVSLQLAHIPRPIRAVVALETLFPLVRLHVRLEGVPVGEGLVALLAQQRIVGGVQLLDVNAEVSLAATSRRTEVALEHRLVAHIVDQLVGLHRVGLRESRLADVAHVRLFARVRPKVSLQLERVRRRVRAMGTLIRSLSRVAADVATQLAQFHTRVIAVWTLVGLLESVLVPDVSHQFATGRESVLAVLAVMRLSSGVRIHVVVQTGHRLEAALTYHTLVRPFVAVAFHVPGQQVSLQGHVVAVRAVELG